MPKHINTSEMGVLEALPNDVMALVELISERGWRVSMTTDTNVGHCDKMKVVISREEDWLGMLYPSLSYAIFSPTTDESDVVVALKKMASLSVAMEAVFSDTFPDQSIDAGGVIWEDKDALCASKISNVALLEMLQEKRRRRWDEKPAEAHTLCVMSNGFISLQNEHNECLLSEKELRVLEVALRERISQ